MIVSDAGPLIALGRIGRLDLLRGIAGIVYIPLAVLAECRAGKDLPGAAAIGRAIQQGWLQRRRATPSDMPVGAQNLGDGELAAISLARAMNLPVLLDDRLARKHARRLRVEVIGTAALLIEAKRRRLIPKVRPLLEDLRGAGYRLSDELVDLVLTRCRESTGK